MRARIVGSRSSCVLGRLPDPPSYSAVRAVLRVLEDKGHLKHKHDGPRYVYQATVPRARARRDNVGETGLGWAKVLGEEDEGVGMMYRSAPCLLVAYILLGRVLDPKL